MTSSRSVGSYGNPKERRGLSQGIIAGFPYDGQGCQAGMGAVGEVKRGRVCETVWGRQKAH